MARLYPTKQEYLIQLENEEFRKRITELKAEIARLNAELAICKEVQEKKKPRGRVKEG